MGIIHSCTSNKTQDFEKLSKLNTCSFLFWYVYKYGVYKYIGHFSICFHS